jgi:serine/threonine-protein kinase
VIEEHAVEEEVAPEPPPPRNPWLWLALLAVAVVAAAIVFIAVLADRLGDDDDARPATTETVVVAPATTVVVPELVGLDHADAGRAAEDLGLVANTYPVESGAPAGQVVTQEPDSGVELATDERLRLDVSLGPDPLVAVMVPDVTGAEGAQAREILRRAGFTVLTVDEDAPTPDEAGRVLLQDPAAGTEAAALTQVTVYVAR